MKDQLYSFSEYVAEMRKEYFSVNFKPEDLEKLKEGDQILYRGGKFTVISADKYSIQAKDEEGKKRTFNFNMFKDYGAIK
jgi:hypothetical protein